jgi:hypothetical protein
MFQVLGGKLFLSGHFRVQMKEAFGFTVISRHSHFDFLPLGSPNLIARHFPETGQQPIQVRAQIQPQGTSRTRQFMPTKPIQQSPCGLAKLTSPFRSNIDEGESLSVAFLHQAAESRFHQPQVVGNRTPVHGKCPDWPQNSSRGIEHTALREPANLPLLAEQRQMCSRTGPLGKLEGVRRVLSVQKSGYFLNNGRGA